MTLNWTLFLPSLCFCVTTMSLQLFALNEVGVDMHKMASVEYKQVDKSFFDGVKSRLKKYRLKNGFEVVLLKDATVPKVFMAVGYRVGSAHESSKTRGMAHLLEHMIFKGTQKISETDIWAICSKYGAQVNAFTFTDGTFYHFEVDKCNWKPFMDILADCSTNLRCDPEHLASELKAVVQELKMNRDSAWRVAWYNICKSVFPANHPYFHPTIGYIQELAKMDPKALFEFYKAHYRPKNATIFMVGDFEFDEAQEVIESRFGSIPDTGEREQAVFPPVIKVPVANNIRVYHEVGVPTFFMAWPVDGLSVIKNSIIADLCASLLSNEHGGRLKKLLVDDLKIAQDVNVSNQSLVHGAVFMISVTADQSNVQKCQEVIKKELQSLATNLVDQSEVALIASSLQNRGISGLGSLSNTCIELFMRVLSSQSFQPESLFDDYLTIGSITAEDVLAFFKNFISPDFNTVVEIMPIPQEVSDMAKKAQEEFRIEEHKILENHQRTAPLEPARLSLTLNSPNPLEFEFAKPTKTMTLKNGIEVVAIQRDSLPQVSAVISSRDSVWASSSLEGNVLHKTLADTLMENSVGFTKEENSKVFNTLGASVNFWQSGAILEVTQPNFEQAFKHLAHVIFSPEFRAQDLEKVIDQNISMFKSFSKNKDACAGRLKQSVFYKGTDFDWSFEDAIDLLKKTDVKAIQNAWAEYSRPGNLVVVLVGALPENWEATVNEALVGIGADQSVGLISREVPEASVVSSCVVSKELSTDQKKVVLARKSSLKLGEVQLIKLGLLNTIVLSGSGSRLFALREATGLFYTANGGFGLSANKKNSMDTIVTIVNPANVEKFKEMVWQMFKKVVAEGITDEEFAGARQTALNDIISKTAKNMVLSSVISDEIINDLGFDYYDKVLKIVNQTTKEELMELAKQYCNDQDWVTISAGGAV